MEKSPPRVRSRTPPRTTTAKPPPDKKVADAGTASDDLVAALKLEIKNLRLEGKRHQRKQQDLLARNEDLEVQVVAG